MLFEDLRYLHEDNERLEAAIADRLLEEPRNPRHQLARDHEISNLLSRIQDQSQKALQLYQNEQDALLQEVQLLSTGDVLESFYKQLGEAKSYHKRYPNAPVENLERAYKRTADGQLTFAVNMDTMFAGEEAYGRFFDLTTYHQDYMSLPVVKDRKKPTYVQYLELFDKFTKPQCVLSQAEKLMDEYFAYLGGLATYLESFLKRTKPLDDLQKLFEDFDKEFDILWAEHKVPGWRADESHTNGNNTNGIATEGTGEGVWCADCEKEFKNDNVYKAHLSGKKHIKNAEAKNSSSTKSTAPVSASIDSRKVMQRAIAEREHRIRKVTASMKSVRDETTANVERRAGMTERERKQELEALYAEDSDLYSMAIDMSNGTTGDGEDADGEEKIYNPLKLPLGWDGKPIPFWLYKLHGLGTEFSCEICGNYVYMGRRAFEKHFSEARHIYGLKCLGITNPSLFREITKIDEAMRLWEKVQRDKKEVEARNENVEEMEDTSGTVMPRRVYEDLEKAGLL